MSEKISLSVEQGQLLLQIASGFSLPEKLGSETYTVADRSIAGDEVRLLYRELKSRSPLMSSKERWQRFGPPMDGEHEIWHEVKGESGRIGHRLVDPDFQVEISVNDEVISGLVWCLIVGIHPTSSSVQTLSHQESVLWPLSEKLEMSKVIRNAVGLDSPSAKPRRWKTDVEFSVDKKEPKKD